MHGGGWSVSVRAISHPQMGKLSRMLRFGGSNQSLASSIAIGTNPEMLVRQTVKGREDRFTTRVCFLRLYDGRCDQLESWPEQDYEKRTWFYSEDYRCPCGSKNCQWGRQEKEVRF